MSERNVLGAPLESCGTDPLTGFYRDGCCSTGPEDLGRHTICAVVTAEFLEHQRSIGNDLTTPMPAYRFPGLGAGRPLVRHGGQLAARVRGRGGRVRGARVDARGTLDLVPLEALQALAVDVPEDAGPFGAG